MRKERKKSLQIGSQDGIIKYNKRAGIWKACMDREKRLPISRLGETESIDTTE